MEGILIALAVFLLSMDQQVLTRALSRPLIACTVFGMILGNVTAGATVGAALELIVLTFNTEVYYLHRPSTVLLSCFTVLLAVKGGFAAEEAIGLAIIFIGIHAGIVHLLSVFNTAFLPSARKAAETRNEKKLAAVNFIPLVISGLVPAVVAYLGVMNAEAYAASLETAGENLGWILEGFAAAAYLLPLLGFAVLLRNLNAKDMPGAFFAGFACAVLAGSLFSFESAAVICAIFAFAIGAYDYHANIKGSGASSNTEKTVKKGESGQWW